MDKEIHDHQQALSSNAIKQESPKRPPQLVGFGGGGNINNDRLKRDEWSEGAVSTLLEAYESKWKLRNRAKLKGQDWEDVAKYVSSRSNGTKTPKTQTQCKNKIESMKKRYRSESVNTDASSWPLYHRLDLLLRGDSSGSTAAVAAAAQTSLPLSLPQPITQVPPLLSVTSAANPDSLILMGQSPVVVKPPPPPPPVVFAQPLPQPVGTQQQNSHGSNGVEKGAKEDGEVGPTISDHESDKKAMDTDSSTPALYSDKEKLMRHRRLKKKKRKIREEMEIADSVRWLAEVVVRSEQSRMETMKEIEKMRIEAEAKRSEMDLKRTEIIANTQLEIAKIFAAAVAKNVDSSLKIGRS